MKLKNLFETEKFILEVTIPQSMEFVDAALAGGAHALKMRCNQSNMSGFSNGIYSGPFQTRKAFLKEVVEHAGDRPVGLVPGTPGSFVTEAECAEMEEIGIDFLNCEPMFLPPYMMDSKKLTKVLCCTYENRHQDLYRWLDEDERVDAVEAGFLPHSEFGRRLYYYDIFQYRDIVKQIHKPIIAPAEKHILPEELKYLYNEGIKCVMIGLSVYYEFLREVGGPLTPALVTQITARYREAIDKL